MVATGKSAVSTLEITVSANLSSLLCLLLPLSSVSAAELLDATGSTGFCIQRGGRMGLLRSKSLL